MSVTVAQRQRHRRAAALRGVAMGRLPLRAVLRDGHTALDSCPIWRLLMAAPSVGKATVRETLERSSVWPLLSLGELTELQRQAILNELPKRVK